MEHHDIGCPFRAHARSTGGRWVSIANKRERGDSVDANCVGPE